MRSLPLTPVAPSPAAARRAAMPPRHLADLDLAGRSALLADLGEPAFRAKQVSTHYFGRLERDPAAMTDLPAATDEYKKSPEPPFPPGKRPSADAP